MIHWSRHASGLLAGVVALSLVVSSTEAAPAEGKPNVLFIAIDDLNDWIGCMRGHPQAQTPNLDRLAQRGILFTNAHCAAPVCLASRAAVLSGRYPSQTGIYSNWGKTKGRPLSKEAQLPAHFASTGYETLGTGKIAHSAAPELFHSYFDTEQRWSPFTAEQAQYTEAELPSKGSAAPRHEMKNGPGGRDWRLPFNGLPSERNASGKEGESFDWGPAPVRDEEMGDTRITDWAIQKLGTARDKPCFLAVGYYRPHIPLFAPQQDFDALPPVERITLPAHPPDDLEDLGPVGRQFAFDPITAGTHSLVTKHAQWKSAVRAYLACVRYVDRQIGRLLDALDASPSAENTWIILWSDHGWQLGEKEHWGKWTAWRQSTRVPLIIVPPRNDTRARRGEQCAEAVSLVDLFPTLIEVCGLPARPGLSGSSLAPLLSNPGKNTGRGVLTTIDPGNTAFSERDWRYIRYHTGEEELYNTAADPREWHNLAHDPAQLEKLRELRAKSEAARLASETPSKNAPR